MGGGSSHGSSFGGHGGGHGQSYGGFSHKPPKHHGGGGGGGMGIGGTALGGKLSVFRSVSRPGSHAVSLSLVGAGLLGGLLVADAVEDIFDDF